MCEVAETNNDVLLRRRRASALGDPSSGSTMDLTYALGRREQAQAYFFRTREASRQQAGVPHTQSTTQPQFNLHYNQQYTLRYNQQYPQGYSYLQGIVAGLNIQVMSQNISAQRKKRRLWRDGANQMAEALPTFPQISCLQISGLGRGFGWIKGAGFQTQRSFGNEGEALGDGVAANGPNINTTSSRLLAFHHQPARFGINRSREGLGREEGGFEKRSKEARKQSGFESTGGSRESHATLGYGRKGGIKSQPGRVSLVYSKGGRKGGVGHGETIATHYFKD
jgi:hypothetical protein